MSLGCFIFKNKLNYGSVLSGLAEDHVLLRSREEDGSAGVDGDGRRDAGAGEEHKLEGCICGDAVEKGTCTLWMLYVVFSGICPVYLHWRIALLDQDVGSV